jgi:hypothetical protein
MVALRPNVNSTAKLPGFGKGLLYNRGKTSLGFPLQSTIYSLCRFYVRYEISSQTRQVGFSCPKLLENLPLDDIRECFHFKCYSIRNEQAYVYWEYGAAPNAVCAMPKS